MNYKDCLEYLFSQLPMYQRTGAAAYKKDIGNIIEACNFLDNPHKKFKSIHIAGTNGKGSTAHLISSIMQEAGYKTGLYTSPHLIDFRERIKIDGKKIKKENVIEFVKKNRDEFEKINMSFFEYTVAMAFDEFSKQKVDIAIIETGLGGRLDSTNIITPELSIITNIGFDHMNLLGNTLEKIAFEKAGIIKKNIPTIIGRKQKEIEQIFIKVAKEKKSHIIFAKKYENSLNPKLAEYQKENIDTAVTAIKALDWQINDKIIKLGIENVILNTGIRGRWETIGEKPKIICDTGHNIDGIKNILLELEKINFEKLHFVFGTVNDKNLDEILAIIPQKAQYYFCQAKIDRALCSKKLKIKADKFNISGIAYESVEIALKNAKKYAKEEDLIIVGGSTFVVAEVL